jgi:hypothetical protein
MFAVLVFCDGAHATAWRAVRQVINVLCRHDVSHSSSVAGSLVSALARGGRADVHVQPLGVGFSGCFSGSSLCVSYWQFSVPVASSVMPDPRV